MNSSLIADAQTQGPCLRIRKELYHCAQPHPSTSPLLTTSSLCCVALTKSWKETSIIPRTGEECGYAVDKNQGGLIAREGNPGRLIYMQKNGTASIDHRKIWQQGVLDKTEQGTQWTKRDWQTAGGGWMLRCQLQEDFPFCT